MRDDPAFPMPETETHVAFWGLTKREYFIGKAIEGYCVQGRGNPREIAESAVMVADALIRELSEGGE